MKMAKPSAKKFKVVEKDATIESKFHAKVDVGDVDWHGESLETESKTRLDQDTGTGIPIIIRMFRFAANPQTFKDHKPTAQELFNSHQRFLLSELWKDVLSPYEAVEPRIVFPKDGKSYEFYVGCIPSAGQVLNETPQTLTEILHK